MDTGIFFEKLDALFSHKDTKQAETYMKGCLAQAEAENDLPAIVTICNELGGFYRTLSRYKEGIPLYDRALEIISALEQENTPAHGTTLINYATICTMTGQQEKALDLYEQAAKIFKEPAYAGDFNLAALYNNMSLLCQDMGNYAQAETYLREALHILQKLTDSEAEIAITYTNLAQICAAENRLEEAENLLQQAIDLFRQHSGENDVHYAAAVNTLGEVRYLRGDYKKAAEAFETALALHIRDFGEDTESCRAIRNNLALCRSRLKEEEQQ